MILNILGAIMCCSFVGANTLGSIETSQEVSFHQENKKLATFNDETYTITLTANELNSYIWSNFYQLLVSNDVTMEDYVNSLIYNSDTFLYDTNDSGAFMYTHEIDASNYYDLRFIYDVDTYNSEYDTDFEDNYIFIYILVGNDIQYIDFEYDLQFILAENSFYDDVKTAIELDIEANQSASMGDVLSDFITILVSGISTLATGIASGIVDMSKSLFLTIDSGTGAITGLSVFGGLIALFAGLALAIGITTRVYLWVSSLGKD